jgi:hypothetical protein
MRLRRLRPVVVAFICSALIGGCAQPRNSLGTGSGPCFRALPVAAQMVHHKGKLIGVRRAGAEQRSRTGAVRPARGRGVCLVAFRGHFGPTTVDKPVNQERGDYAVAVVAVSGNRPLRTIVTSQPVRFRHL